MQQPLPLPYPSDRDDPALDEVAAWLREVTTDPTAFFGRLIRQAIDEVLDGQRTGRWDFDQLEKTEKTYVGTKLEILVRSAFGLERDKANLLDLEILGHPVDVKWAFNSSWQIPDEAIGHLCLCLGGRKDLSHFQVGLVRCLPELLNRGRNKDGKTTLSVAGRAAMELIVPVTPLAPNFVATMDDAVRTRIMDARTVQGRVTRLFHELLHVPIPRSAICTIARTEGDPIRRTRADQHNDDPLDGVHAISYTKSWQAEKLGFPPLCKETQEFLSVTNEEFARLPEEYRGNKRPG